MDNEFDPKSNDPQDKHRRAQRDLEDLKRMLAEIQMDQPEKIHKVELPAQEAVEPQEKPSVDEQPEIDEPKTEKKVPVKKKELPKQEKEAEPKQEAADMLDVSDVSGEAAPAVEPEHISEEPVSEPRRDVQADQEQKQREEILNRQAKRRHPDQPAATMHLGGADKKTAASSAAKKNSKNSKTRAARRRKRRLMRLGTVIVVLLLAIVLVVSAVRGISKKGIPLIGSGSGEISSSQTPEEPQDDLPASQQECAQYKKIKDDTSLPSYALEYPGMYADAVGEPNKESEEKVCYLTFDDGPSSTNTPGILDALKEADVKATFFVVASEIDGSEDVLRRIVDEGHTLCIHCNAHEYGNLYQSVDAYLEDFAAAYDKIYEITGYRVQGLRFPGGSNNTVMQRHGTYDAIVSEMTRRGFEYYDWNAYAHDAENGDYTVEQMVNYAVSEVKSSSRKDAILLMHDTYDKEKTVQALPAIIEQLKDAGIEMKPITATTRPVHFEVNENTPPDLPESDEESDSDTDSSDSTDEN